MKSLCRRICGIILRQHTRESDTMADERIERRIDAPVEQLWRVMAERFEQ